MNGEKITIHGWPDSQVCMGCRHGEFIQSEKFDSSHYACLIGSTKNNGIVCEDRTFVDLASPESVEEVAMIAEAAFWRTVAKFFPSCTSGDFPPDAQIRFKEATEEAVKTWLSANHPAMQDKDDVDFK